MAGSKEPFRVKLTKEQQDEIRRVTGKHAEALELSVEELEARIAPVMVRPGPKPLGIEPVND